MQHLRIVFINRRLIRRQKRRLRKKVVFLRQKNIFFSGGKKQCEEKVENGPASMESGPGRKICWRGAYGRIQFVETNRIVNFPVLIPLLPKFIM